VRGNPTSADMRLVVEVSDATLWRTAYQSPNLRQHRCARIWVLDVNGRRLFVYRQPMSTGYADTQEYDETASIAPLASPNSPVKVADLLP